MKKLAELTQGGHWFRFWLPYKFEKLESPKRKHVYLPLNRNYKPLGITSRDHVDYAAYMHQAVVFASDPTKFTGVWHDPKGLWLYDDTSNSRVDYFERLSRLTDRTMKLVGAPSR